MPRLSVSTWSLHRNLGPLRLTRRDASGNLVPEEKAQPQALTLLELPARLAARGIEAAEVCHFHFPRTDDAYLAQLRQAFTDAGVTFFSLLIDYGDITHPDPTLREEELRFIERWIDVAGRVGARCVRVSAGDAPPEDADAVALAARHLRRLAGRGTALGVRILTENWRRLASTAENVCAILDATGGEVGLCADFGNFPRPGKYDALAAILPRAETIHAKIEVSRDGAWDVDDFRRCLDLARSAGFRGTYAMVHDGPGDQWAGLQRLQALVTPYL